MTIYRAQITLGADTALPRDRFVLTPHFRDDAPVELPGNRDGLAADLAEVIRTTLVPNTREISVKISDAQGTPPVFPVGEALVNPNGFPASTLPREVALCLSFYSGRNVPRRRGRIYVPAAALSTGTSIGARPGTAMWDTMQSLAEKFQTLGGTTIDWVVYSRSDNEAYPVTDWWVDDEWDVQRRRGMRATNRRIGTTSEA